MFNTTDTAESSTDIGSNLPQARQQSFSPPIGKLFGLNLIQAEDGQAVVQLDADGRHANPMGTLHGGVLCDLADATMGIAYRTTLAQHESFTTLLVEGASVRLDLHEHRLPFLNEPASPTATGGLFSEPAAEAWRRRIGEFDAFVALVAEYNHGPTAVLKNAFDSALNEWQRKPIAFVGYGRVGAARAIETLRGVVIELHGCDPARCEHRDRAVSGHPTKGSRVNDYEYLDRSRKAMFDHLVYWGEALKAARQRTNESSLTTEASICALFSS